MADDNTYNDSTSGSETTDTKKKGASITGKEKTNDISIKSGNDGSTKIQETAPEHSKEVEKDLKEATPQQAEKGPNQQKELVQKEVDKSIEAEMQKRADIRAAFLELAALEKMGVKSPVIDQQKEEIGKLVSPDQKIALDKELEVQLG